MDVPGLLVRSLPTFEDGQTFPQLGNFSRTGGTVNFMGTMIGGLMLDDTLGTWRMVPGAVIDGGIIDTVPGSAARLQYSYGSFGSLSDLRALQTDVRFCRDSRHWRPSRSGQLWARRGHSLDALVSLVLLVPNCSQKPPYRGEGKSNRRN